MHPRHIAGALAAFIVALSLAACGGGDDDASVAATEADREQPAARKPIPGVVLAADAGVRSMTLHWNDNGARRYDVYLSSSPDCDIAQYSLCPDGRLVPNVRPPYKVESLDNGRTYYAKVEAIYAKGSSLSNLAGAKPTTLEFNAAVWAIANAADGTTYVGGDFTRVGLTSGQGVALGALDGRPLVAGYPVIGGGGVSAAAPDGAGGWYIGGDFLRVGSTPKRYLAHMRADGTLDPNWNPQPDNAVNAIAVMNGVVYIGGRFQRVNGQQRASLAAIDAAGNLTAWNPNPNLGVWAIAAANGRIYIGGTFTEVGAFRRNHLAAIDAFGNVLPWDPNADGTVAALAVAGSTVYAGGFFRNVSGQPRTMVAAIGATSGSATAWNPSSQPCVACEVLAIAVHNGSVYIGGRFTQIGSAQRRSLAAIDAAGNVLPWNPAFDGYQVKALAVTTDPARGTAVHVGGDFESIGGQPRAYLAALNLQGAALAWQPAPNGVVEVLAASGNALYAGGRFTGLNAVVRNRIAAIDAAGSLKAWNPGADSGVYALAVQGDTIHVGGSFTTLGGQPRARIARLDPAGNVAGWNPGIDKSVRAFALGAEGTLYVGGEFGYVAGTPRNRLAAFAASGQLLGWSPNADRDVHALAAGPYFVTGETVYVGGSFGFINGQVRRRIAQIDAQAQPTAWNPWGFELVQPGEAVHALAYANGVIYAGGAFSRLGTNLSQINENGAIDLWAVAQYPVWSLAVSGRTLYIGGDFGTVTTVATPQVPRNRLAALDIVERRVTAWNPDVDGSVYALLAADGALHAGGAFTAVGGQVEGAFATLAP